MANKRYFKCLKLLAGRTIIEYWHTNNTSLLRQMFDFIIPLGYNKPKDKEIHEA